MNEFSKKRSNKIKLENRETNKTKKNKQKRDLNKIWNIFENDKINGNKKETTENVDVIKKREYCDLCKSALFVGDEGYLVCSSNACGIIYYDSLDETAEWRYYGANDNQNSDPTRCGMPTNPLLKESSFGCKVICNGKSSYEMRKIRRYTEWQSMPYKEKSQYDEFERIKIMANHKGIPKLIIDDALRTYKKISEEKTFRSLNRDGIIAASIYISCRMNQNPRTPKEIASIFYLDNTSATKGCKNALIILNKLEKNMDVEDKTMMCQTKPTAFIERYCSKLNINNELTKLCLFIALRIEKNNLIPENTPHSVACGIVYFISHSCKLNVSKKDVRAVSEVSEVTINKCYKKIEKMKDKLIPTKIKEKYYIE